MTENNFQINSAAVSDRGLSEKRPQNEDSFLEMKNLGLFAVADGVGGAQAGDVASQMAVEILGEAFVNLHANGDAEEMMRIAIERANSAIHQMSSDLPQLSTMATTIVALHISGNIATIGHVGDSRLYRLDAKGSLFRETQDHSVVEEEVRAGRMTAAQAANHPSRNVISRALGAESTVEVDMKTIMFDSNTSFLLCSDGITRHINDFEIRELLLTESTPAEICAKMKDICYSRGAEDNLTAVIVNLVGAAASEFSKAPASVAHTLDEEATVATARPPVPEPAFADAKDEYEEIPTRGLEMPPTMQSPHSNDFTPPVENVSYSKDDDESYLMEEPRPDQIETMPEPEPVPNTMAFAADEVSEAPPIVIPQKNVVREKEFASFEPEEKREGAFSKLLSSLVLLAIGAILGVAGYYFWQLSVADKPVTPILTPQTNDIPKKTTDSLRYVADTNPDRIIKQYEASQPKDASDFYILGRAYLNGKKYEEAKKAFIDARNRLKDVTDPETKAILGTDIAQGLTISQDKTVQPSYERESSYSKEGDTGKSTNTNTNQ